MRTKVKPCVAIILYMIVINSCATGYKHDPLTTSDYVLGSTALIFHGVDWLQTKTGIKQSNISESNIMLGANPSQKNIDLYFVTTGIGMSMLTWYLPKGYRKTTLLVWNSMGIITILHNNSIGVKITF